jgi:hypothetical protein
MNSRKGTGGGEGYSNIRKRNIQDITFGNKTIY